MPYKSNQRVGQFDFFCVYATAMVALLIKKFLVIRAQSHPFVSPREPTKRFSGTSYFIVKISMGAKGLNFIDELQ